MNLIEKVVIKDGVSADTTVTINLYTGQVDEINALLVHPNIPNTRGVAAYSLVANKPTFSFSAISPNEMWVYVDGIAIKCGGVTTFEADSSIIVLPNYPDGTCIYDATQDNKILVVNNASNISYLNVNALADEKSFILQNERTSSIYVTKQIGMTVSSFEIKPSEILMVKKVTSVSKPKYFFITGPNLKNRNLTVSDSITTTTDEASFNDYLPINFVFFGTGNKTLNISQFGTVGREIRVIMNAYLGITYQCTINLPAGETFINGDTSVQFSGSKALFKTDGDSWTFY